MKYRALSHQKRAFDDTTRMRSAFLALDLGLGKTVIAASIIQDQLDLELVDKVLIVGTKRIVTHTWTREHQKWDHLTYAYSVITGTPNQREQALHHGDVHLINYENLVWLIKHWGHDWPYDLVVFDEISKMKSPTSKRFRAFRQVRKYVNNVIGLTGSPATNGLIDLWAQIWLIDMGERLGRTFSAFKDRWFITNQWSHEVEYRPGAEEEIHSRISDIAISMAAEDYLQMPDRFDVINWVDLPPSVMAGYSRLERDMFLRLKQGDIAAVNAAVLTGKCLQYTSGALYHEDKSWEQVHDEKLDELESILEEADGPVLVSYNFNSDLDRLKARFPHARTINSDETIDEWNRGEIPLLLVHPASAGHGLNLQEGGHRLVWFSLTWSLELYQQLNGRLYRQGQTKPVTVHHIVARDTIDAVVLNALRNKRRVQDALLDAIAIPTSQGDSNGQEKETNHTQSAARIDTADHYPTA
jgi:SNF2 family DNA or RNA helicase